MIKLNTGNLNKKVDISQQRRNGLICPNPYG